MPKVFATRMIIWKQLVNYPRINAAASNEAYFAPTYVFVLGWKILVKKTNT